jgi:hypothetical protein
MPAEDKGVTAFQSHHALALLRQAHQQAVDVVLGQGVPRRLLAHVMKFRVHSHPVQYFLAHQVVVDHRIGLGNQPRRLQGQEIRVTRAATYQIHRAGLDGA